MTPAEKVVAHLREQGEKQVRAARQLEGSGQHMAAMLRLGAQEMTALADVVEAAVLAADICEAHPHGGKPGCGCAPCALHAAIRRAAEVCG